MRIPVGPNRNSWNAALLSAGLVCAGVVGVGARTMFRYENTAGIPAAPPSRWPAHTKIIPRHGVFTLVLFAHPDCPCTRATLEQLNRLLSRASDALSAVVEFRKPGVSLAEVQKSSLWKQASSIPGLSVALDNDGLETREFRASVSGQTMLYDATGKLVFSGGITAARGHAGDNPASGAVLLHIAGRAAATQAPVFGCSLLDPDQDELAQSPSWKR